MCDNITRFANCKFQKNILFLRKIRISLKYRPEIFKLILRMRQSLKRKKSLINELKHQLCTLLRKVKFEENDICLKSTENISDDEETVIENQMHADNVMFKKEKRQNANQLVIQTTALNSTKNQDKSCQTAEKKDLIEACMAIKKVDHPVSLAIVEHETNFIVDKKCIGAELEKSERSYPNNQILKSSKDSCFQTENFVRSKLNDAILKETKDSCCQTSKELLLSLKLSEDPIDQKCNKTSDAWNITKNNGEEKSIAEQVEEAAQSALQETGMVYVESAGMYYDYKTGYYYNSELGLYYHTDTGCYYYYSDDKKSFVFHSYPDRGTKPEDSTIAVCTSRKRPKKIKKASKTDSCIDNLTKNFSQDAEDLNEGSKAKRPKKSSKKKVSKAKLNSEIKNVDETKDSEYEHVQSDTKEEDLKSSEISEDHNNTKDVTIKNKIDSNSDDLEDGECSESASENSEEESSCSTETDSDDDAVAKHHPPSMRVIVRETNIPKLKVGSLFLVTKDGGTLGREGEQHAILIRDSSVSRTHLDIRYDIDRQIYIITDLGSKNGTVLNGIRMSESQVTSEPMEVVHGSTIQLGETKLLCHIHPGNDTCGHCEPGLIMEMQDIEKKVAYTRTCSVKKQHQMELARLKNMYAPQLLSIEDGTYNDRAKTRREVVGSSHDAEKTQSTDLDTFIAPENKGFKLLEKMGWSKGEGLGKDSQGDTEPIPLMVNEGKSGLGTQGATTTPGPAPFVRRSNIGPATLRLANKTKMLQPPAKAFQNTLDEDNDEE